MKTWLCPTANNDALNKIASMENQGSLQTTPKQLISSEVNIDEFFFLVLSFEMKKVKDNAGQYIKISAYTFKGTQININPDKSIVTILSELDNVNILIVNAIDGGSIH